MKRTSKTLLLVFVVFSLLVATVSVDRQAATAAQVQLRSITLSSSTPSAQVSHVFSFTVPDTSVIGSIKFEHCTNDPFVGAPCTVPAGLSLNAAILSAQSGNTGFTIDGPNSTANSIVLTRAPVAAVVASSSYTLTSVTNPSTPSQSVYVRISLHASTDASGAPTHDGGLAYKILGNFSVGAYVPPFLIFCAGLTVSLDCSATNGLLIDFGELSYTQTKTATSQFSGASNDHTGYNVFISGQTMTAGNQAINPLASNQSSSIGSAQFGLNLRGNTVPVVGANPNGVGSAVISGGYNTPNSYRFVSGEQLVSSTLSTDFNRHTVSYIVNVPRDQAPGYYATTLTFIATASF